MSAVRFAAAANRDLQQPLLDAAWELLPSQASPPRRCVTLLAGALAPVLTPPQVAKRVVPAAVMLLRDPEPAVGEGAARLLVLLYGMFAGEAAIAGRVQEELESAIPAAVHAVQLAALHALTEGAPSYGPVQLEFVLKQIQWLVSTLHEVSGSNVRAPSQLREMAGVILEALRVIDSCQLLDEALRLLHLTGLLALQHDQELLDGVQRDLLAAMLRDREGGKEETPTAAAVRGDLYDGAFWGDGWGPVAMLRRGNVAAHAPWGLLKMLFLPCNALGMPRLWGCLVHCGGALYTVGAPRKFLN